MKKLFLFAAMVALILNSCSNDEELGIPNESTGSAIEFRSLTDKATLKAATTDGDNILSLTVTGIKDSDGGYLFNGFGITRGESSNWAYTPLRYWPANDKVDFYAYSPTASKNVTTGTGLTDFTPGDLLTYTVPTIAINDAQEDFLIARITDQNESSGAVKLNFQHALSRVTFSAKTTQNNITYIITGVELMNLNSTAKIDLTHNDIPETGGYDYVAASQIPLVIWGNHSVPTSYSVDKGDAPIYMTTDYTSLLGVTNGLMVMPQTTELYNNGAVTTTPPANTDEFAIKVSYKAFVDDIYYAGSATTDAVKYFPVTISNTAITFEIGRQYNFYLTFGDEVGAPIEFEVEVSEWNNPTNVYLPNYGTKGYFPDVDFLDYLISAGAGHDSNGDSMLSYEELQNILEITVPANTSDLTGIELMPNLVTINFTGVELPTLPDYPGLANITTISIGGSSGGVDTAAEIDKLSKLVNLQKVTLATGNVRYDLSGNPKVNDIRFAGNYIKVNIEGTYTYDDIMSDADPTSIPEGKVNLAGTSNGSSLFVQKVQIVLYYSGLNAADGTAW